MMDTDFGPLPDDLAAEIRHVTDTFGGWCTFEKARDMAALILREKPAVVVEVGVYRGRSFVPQALAVRRNGSGVAYAIDAWSADATGRGKQPESEKWWATNDFEADYQFLLREIDRRGLRPFADVWRCESAEAAASFGPEPSIDIAHVDANHSEECSLEDVSLWLPLVKPGGWIWLDDVDWETVREAYRWTESRCVKVGDFGRWSLFRKLPVDPGPVIG